MTEEERKDLDELNLLIKAVRYNHNKGNKPFNAIVNPDVEIELYQSRIARLSLPHRFGMYKSLPNNARPMDIELEEPGKMPDSTSHGNQNPNHRKRGIFD